MRGTFNGSQSPYVYDHLRAEAERVESERQARNRMDQRVMGFIGRHMAGRTFATREAMENAICAAAVQNLGRALTDEQHAAVQRCVRALFGGVALRADLGRGYSRRDGAVTIEGDQQERVA